MKKSLIYIPLLPLQNLTQLKYCHSCDILGNCVKAWHRHKEAMVLFCLLHSSRSILSVRAWASLNALNLKQPCRVLVLLCPLFQGKKSISTRFHPHCSACLPILLKASCHCQTWDPWSCTLGCPFASQGFCQENNFVASVRLGGL